VAERKNIFLIGRRSHEHDEDQLTEMLAFLWQEERRTLERWLESLGLPTEVGTAEVETQFRLPSGKRPDIVIRSTEGTTLVESKLGSGFGETQVAAASNRTALRLTDRHGRVQRKIVKFAKL
jgi:hypothetical protein